MYEEVIEKINTADYEDAYKLIVDIKKKSSNYDGELAILEAETCYQMGYRQEMFHAIGKGIQIEPENYELFFYWVTIIWMLICNRHICVMNRRNSIVKIMKI